MKIYGKIFRKVIIGFLAVYIGMMGIFTYNKVLDVRAAYRNQIFIILDNVKDRVKAEYSKEEVEGKARLGHLSQLARVLTRAVEYTNEFQIHAVTAIFKEEKQVARSGYYLTAGNVDWELNEVEDGDKYIDLEKCFNDEEMLQFIELVNDIECNEETLLWIKAEGYVAENEVFPKLIEVYKIDKTYEEGMEGGYWRDEEAVLVKAYAFDIEQESMAPYQFDDWRPVIPIECSRNNERVNSGQLNKITLEKYRKLEADMYNWEDVEEGRRFRFEETWDKVRYFVYNEVETETGEYLVRLGLEYEPVLVAVGDLKLVYSFSLVVVILMSLILTYGLWQTEKKKQLLEKNRRMLIDAIGHELKTPLSIITAYSEGLKEKIAEDKREHYIDVIVDEINHMNHLIVEMLNLSKFESGAYKLQLEQFKINDLLMTCLKNKKKLFEDYQIQLVLEMSHELEVKADYSCIEKVINNILMNAIAHTSKQGKLTVKIEGKKVSIQNEGQPIPDEMLKNIWQSFYKGENIVNRSGEGTGLGLAIVKHILELHRWQYGAYNTRSGVCFWFQVK